MLGNLKFNKVVLASLVLTSLAGCAAQERMKEVSTNADIATDEGSYALRQIQEKPEVELIQRSNDFFVNTTAVSMTEKAKRLPKLYSQQVSVNKNSKLNMVEVAEVISRDIGVKVTLSPDLAYNLRENGISMEAPENNFFMSDASFDGGFTDDSTSVAPEMLAQDSTSALPPPMVTPSSSGSGENESAAGLGSMHLQYQGTLKGLLDLVGSRLNVFWRHEDDGVIFYQYDTRNYMVAVIPGETELEASVSNESGQDGGGSGTSETTTSSTQSSTQSTAMTGTFGVWGEMQEAVEAMLSETGVMAMSATSGSVTVTDNPMVLKRVGEYIDNLNDVMTRQVVVSVKVYNVTRNNADALGINWDTVYTALNGDYSIGFDSAESSGLAGDSSELTATVLSPTSAFQGSNAILRALSTQGKVSLVTSASVMTLNNQPVPVQVAQQTTYLASSGIIGSGFSNDNDNGLGGTGTELRPGTVTTGFGMNILPRILDSQQLLMQYSIDLSSLDSLDDITSGSQRIQAPNISTRNFMQRVALQSGDSLVLTGFEGVSNDSFRGQTVGIPNEGRAESERNMTVIVMTPMLTQGVRR